MGLALADAGGPEDVDYIKRARHVYPQNDVNETRAIRRSLVLTPTGWP